MINLIHAEWIKLRSVRSTLLMLLLAGGLVVLFSAIAANDHSNHAGSTGDIHLGDLTIGVTVAVFLFGTLGVQVIGQEYRFNTIRPTFTAAPRRFRVLIAKLVVVASAAVVVSAIMIAVSAIVGKVMLGDVAFDSTDQRVVWATLLFAAGWTMYGMGLGAILRQPIAAIVILLIQGLIAEPLLAQNIHTLGPWVPFTNGVQMTGRDPADPEIFRSITAGGIYFFLFTFVLWGVGAYLVNKRDA